MHFHVYIYSGPGPLPPGQVAVAAAARSPARPSKVTTQHPKFSYCQWHLYCFLPCNLCRPHSASLRDLDGVNDTTKLHLRVPRRATDHMSQEEPRA